VEGGYGIWVSYHGQMTEQDRRKLDHESALHSARMKKVYEKRKVMQELQNAMSEIRPESPWR
jgi:hypothetical protein